MMRSRSDTTAPKQKSGPRRAAGIPVLCVLLALPVWAGYRATERLDWRVLLAIPIVMSLLTYLAYRADKRRAEEGKWRIPEFHLHVGELLGGWPGGFLAQRIYRHKTSKISFQLVFWFIVATHQFVAIDSLLGWKVSSRAYNFVREQVIDSPTPTRSSAGW